jgi:hypothetical protein
LLTKLYFIVGYTGRVDTNSLKYAEQSNSWPEACSLTNAETTRTKVGKQMHAHKLSDF